MSTDLNYSATRDPFSALGLDVGNRRIGVAGSDGLGLLATGLGVIRRRSLPEDIAQVQAWIRRRQATVVVVGIPLLADGSVGSQARKVQRFVRALQAAVDLPVVTVNEYLSTVQAEWDLRQAGTPAKAQKALIDQQSAAVILQTWLDERRYSQSSKAPCR
ncbi:Holliday junction resolvase [Synechococcus sp. 60AY4M2]|uniref:Holliday junction resolvase RuvX n=1 Tax=unclassified Synechococcus TaxID=2626047 RepID=UPI000C189041|nr:MULTISPECIES: Holliday junction resolvase RuvX [unclassified Synechococcus]PIK94734.1 Holliday junction resolvase [Synechococcus sp. 60AY4M2]PIK96989.1 Holliday junction resolvase [Synechococcus sp. 63AY4M1]PIL02301.1 Holliday junction resolvase [Synechococcus sp. 65AY640]